MRMQTYSRTHAHAQTRGALTTDEQKQKLKENMELEMKKAAAKSGKADTEISSQMVDMMASSTTVVYVYRVGKP